MSSGTRGVGAGRRGPDQGVVEIAEALARRAHHGQRYGERDYVEAHVARVAALTARLGYGGEPYLAAAWLHDVLEDTEVDREELLRHGIPERVVTAVEALTHREGEAHHDYLRRVAGDPVAVAVKYADSSANFASTVLLSPTLDDARFRSWHDKYATTIAFLRPLLPPTD